MGASSQMCLRLTHRIRTISRVDSCTIEQKSNRRGRFPLALAEGVHELGESGGALNFEEDFVVVVCDLDVEVLTLGLVVGIATGTRGLVMVRHGEG